MNDGTSAPVVATPQKSAQKNKGTDVKNNTA